MCSRFTLFFCRFGKHSHFVVILGSDDMMWLLQQGAPSSLSLAGPQTAKECRLTGHQQEALGLGLHLRALSMLLVGAAVERLAGLMDDRLLQVHLAAQELQAQQAAGQSLAPGQRLIISK